MNSIYKFQFGIDLPKTQVCQKTFTKEELEVLKAAVKDSYMFEMFVSLSYTSLVS